MVGEAEKKRRGQFLPNPYSIVEGSDTTMLNRYSIAEFIKSLKNKRLPQNMRQPLDLVTVFFYLSAGNGYCSGSIIGVIFSIVHSVCAYRAHVIYTR